MENKILKEAKNAQKWHFWVSKWSFLVIFEGFLPLSKFYFPACSTLYIIPKKPNHNSLIGKS